jgi:hypothetical protein
MYLLGAFQANCRKEESKMRNKIFFSSLALLLLFLVSVWAADLNGKWFAEYQSPNGQTRQSTFTFVVKGDTLTGTVASTRGESQIENGKVNGDEISFSVTRNLGGNDVKFQYKGKVSGDEIKFNVTVGEGDRSFDMTAKRMK